MSHACEERRTEEDEQERWWSSRWKGWRTSGCLRPCVVSCYEDVDKGCSSPRQVWLRPPPRFSRRDIARRWGRRCESGSLSSIGVRILWCRLDRPPTLEDERSASVVASALYRIRHLLNSQNLKTMCMMFIRSIMEYNSVCWMGATKSHLSSLDRVQHTAKRMCLHCRTPPR